MKRAKEIRGRESPPSPGRALAVAAHPDDIEFLMAGTLLLLKRRGFELHYMTVASGSCGSAQESAAATRILRRKESLEAARILGAAYHSCLTGDLEVLYQVNLLRRLAAVVREVQPSILLTHSPEDYMEDHMNTCRLAVTAAFARGMPNFRTSPPRRTFQGELRIYHAMPHGLRDGLGRSITPELFVDTSEVQEIKTRALGAHRSQKEWLDLSQGMDSYLGSMEEMSLAMGRMSGRFVHAEGWRAHWHLGFCSPEFRPLESALQACLHLNAAYQKENRV
jgi:N-acetylglucosamine malate deacetylase 1